MLVSATSACDDSVTAGAVVVVVVVAVASYDESAALLSVCTAAAELSLSMSEEPLSEQPAMPKAITTANKRADIFFIMLPPYFFNKFILQHSPMQVNNIFDIYKYFVKYPQTAIVFLQHNVVRKAQHNVV